MILCRVEDRAKIVQEEGESIVELRNIIEQYNSECVRVANKICRTRMRFNAMAPISSLPDELLAIIFKIYFANHWIQNYPLDDPI